MKHLDKNKTHTFTEKEITKTTENYFSKTARSIFVVTPVQEAKQTSFSQKKLTLFAPLSTLACNIRCREASHPPASFLQLTWQGKPYNGLLHQVNYYIFHQKTAAGASTSTQNSMMTLKAPSHWVRAVLTIRLLQNCAWHPAPKHIEAVILLIPRPAAQRETRKRSAAPKRSRHRRTSTFYKDGLTRTGSERPKAPTTRDAKGRFVQLPGPCRVRLSPRPASRTPLTHRGPRRAAARGGRGGGGGRPRAGPRGDTAAASRQERRGEERGVPPVREETGRTEVEGGTEERSGAQRRKGASRRAGGAAAQPGGAAGLRIPRAGAGTLPSAPPLPSRASSLELNAIDPGRPVKTFQRFVQAFLTGEFNKN